MTQQQQDQRPPRQKSELQSRLESFESFLVSPKISSQLAKALPNSIDLNQEIELIKNTIRRTPKLLMCTRESLFAAVVQVFELGLQPTPALGHAYFVPFDMKGRMTCQLIIGYRGFIELARRSGTVSSIRAESVFENDYFRYRLGLEPQLEHVPYDVIRFDDVARAAKRGQTADSPGKLIAAYCVVTLKDGTKEFRVVTDEYVKRVKKMSRSSDRADSPWKQWEDQMWSKTAIRHTLKFVPLSPEDRLVKGLEIDERAFSDVGRSIDTTGVTLTDTDVPEPKGKANGHSTAASTAASSAPAHDDDFFGDGDLGAEAPQTGLDQFVSNTESVANQTDATREPTDDKPAQTQSNSDATPATDAPDTASTGATSGDTTPPDGDGAGGAEAPRRQRRRRNTT